MKVNTQVFNPYSGISVPTYQDPGPEPVKPTPPISMNGQVSEAAMAQYNQAMQQYNQDYQAWLDKSYSSGYDSKGMPIAPDFVSMIDPATGRLKEAYELTPEVMDPRSLGGYDLYEELATGTGLTAGAQEAQKLLDLKTKFARDQASADAAGAAATARSNLAMRGGLSGGARERIATGFNPFEARQQARQAQLLGTADIGMQSAASRENALGNFLNLNRDIEGANIDARNRAEEFNINQALQEMSTERQFAMDRYKEQAEITAAEKKAKAQRRSSCFAAGTQIHMADGTTKNIEDIVIGDELYMGGEVYGIYSGANQDQLFLYGQALVTGIHPVKEDGEWKRVKDSRNAMVTDQRPKVVYDLSCANHRIVIGDVVFGDFAEVDDFYASEEGAIAELNREERYESRRNV